MIVSILRHGQAGSAPIDSQRTLTQKGQDDIRVAGRKFRESLTDRNLPGPGLVLHSPWLRTTQTAEIFTDQVSCAFMEASGALLQDARQQEVDDMLYVVLSREKAVDHVVLISHQPLVSELADYYLGYPNSVPGLSPGAMFSMDMEVPTEGCGRLLFWAVPPNYDSRL